MNSINNYFLKKAQTIKNSLRINKVPFYITKRF